MAKAPTSAKPATKSRIAKKSTTNKIVFEKFEWSLLAPTPIIGVDEVGRGCLAGRVYAAAVVLPAEFKLTGLTDSKLLSEARRESLHAEILGIAHVSIAFAEVHEIDELNILWASMLAMKRAVLGLGVSGGHVLVDGNTKIPKLDGFTQTTVIKGDLRAMPISAASVIAKVTRDRELKQLAVDFPGYGFEKHKGYASELHRDAIKRLGPCVHHRRTFAGVREFLAHSQSRPRG